VRLEDGLKVERQPVPGCELPARGAGQDAATLWGPLETASGARDRQRRKTKRRTVTAFTGHRILFVDVWTNLVQSDVDALSG
jgi:hypothetical protein